MDGWSACPQHFHNEAHSQNASQHPLNTNWFYSNRLIALRDWISFRVDFKSIPVFGKWSNTTSGIANISKMFSSWISHISFDHLPLDPGFPFLHSCCITNWLYIRENCICNRIESHWICKSISFAIYQMARYNENKMKIPEFKYHWLHIERFGARFLTRFWINDIISNAFGVLWIRRMNEL